MMKPTFSSSNEEMASPAAEPELRSAEICGSLTTEPPAMMASPSACTQRSTCLSRWGLKVTLLHHMVRKGAHLCAPPHTHTSLHVSVVARGHSLLLRLFQCIMGS
jgi:hypothetical protein